MGLALATFGGIFLLCGTVSVPAFALGVLTCSLCGLNPECSFTSCISDSAGPAVFAGCQDFFEPDIDRMGDGDERRERYLSLNVLGFEADEK